MSAPSGTADHDQGTGAEFRRNWAALVACTVGLGLGVGALPFYTNGLFVPELEAEFGWSRTQLSSLQLVGSLALIVTAPVVGALVDRIGVRIPATISLVVLALAYFLLSASGPVFVLYLVVWASMYLFASGSTVVSFTRTVNEKFDRGRGLALGIALAGTGLVAFLVPMLLGAQIAEDWRGAYRILGIAVLIGAVLVLLMLPRHSAGTGRAATAVVAPRQPVLELLRTGLFLRLTLAFMAISLAVGGLTVHLVPMLRDAGVAPTSAAAIAGAVGVSVVVGRIVVGILIDRFFAPRVAVLVLGLAAAGYVLLLVGGAPLALAAAIGVGFALGAEVDLMGYLTARYYGLERYGRVFGVLYAVFVLGVGASPLLMSWQRDLTGGYTVPLIVSVVLLGVGAAFMLALPRFPVAAPAPAPATEAAGS
ncbi:MFS transporter [Pseudonocardia kongjuensis]|uniref:MFS transporter n=1 Tax=Pseudonocardia kongjuensis TaxID=102227 RepID=A0ABP4J1B8_9PSEU